MTARDQVAYLPGDEVVYPALVRPVRWLVYLILAAGAVTFASPLLVLSLPLGGGTGPWLHRALWAMLAFPGSWAAAAVVVFATEVAQRRGRRTALVAARHTAVTMPVYGCAIVWGLLSS